MLLWTPYINPRLDNQFENHVMPPHEYKNLMNLRIVMNFPPHLELTNQVSRETNSWNDQTSHMCFHYASHHVTFKSRDIGISANLTWWNGADLQIISRGSSGEIRIFDFLAVITLSMTYVQDANHREKQYVLELNIWVHFRLLYSPTRGCCDYLSISIQNQLEKWLIVCQLRYNHPKK